MSHKLKIKPSKEPTVVIHRVAFKNEKLVYIARTNKKMPYPLGHSRIAYIGTTKKGARRVASSAAWKGEDLLWGYGIKHLEFNIIVCSKVQGVETWKKLERALLIKFRERFGSLPRANKSGKKMHWKDEKKYFSDSRLEKIINEYS